MRQTVAAILGLVVAATVGLFVLTSDGVDAPEIGEAPTLGGETPLAPDGSEPDPTEFVPFIEGEPTYDLDKIPVYDENGEFLYYSGDAP